MIGVKGYDSVKEVVHFDSSVGGGGFGDAMDLQLGHSFVWETNELWRISGGGNNCAKVMIANLKND